MSKPGRKQQDEGPAAGTEEPFRASREASLGADGLNVSQASGTVPARAPDDSRQPAYADSAPASDDEFHASREASLGGPGSASMRAGVLGAEDPGLPQGSQPGDPDPERDWARDSGED